MKSQAPDHGIAIAVVDNYGGHSFAIVANDGSIESPGFPSSIGMVGRQSSGQQRCRNGCLAGVIKSASRFNGTSEIATKAIILIYLVRPSCVTFNLGPMLILYAIGVIIHSVKQPGWLPRVLRRKTLPSIIKFALSVLQHPLNPAAAVCLKKINHRAPFSLAEAAYHGKVGRS